MITAIAASANAQTGEAIKAATEAARQASGDPSGFTLAVWLVVFGTLVVTVLMAWLARRLVIGFDESRKDLKAALETIGQSNTNLVRHVDSLALMISTTQSMVVTSYLTARGIRNPDDLPGDLRRYFEEVQRLQKLQEEHLRKLCQLNGRAA